MCWDFSIGGGDMETKGEKWRQKIAERNIRKMKDAVWSLTGMIPQILVTTEWWKSEVQLMNYGHRITNMKNYGRVNRENRYKFSKNEYPTLSKFDEWTHKFVKDILNGGIKGGRTVETPEGLEWRQRPLIDMLSKIMEEVTEDIHHPKPYSISTITEKKGYGSTRMFQKDAVFRIDSKMKNRDYDMPFRLRNDFGKMSEREVGWEYEGNIGVGFPEVRKFEFWENPYIFYGETDTGGYLWTVKVEFEALAIDEDMDDDNPTSDDLESKTYFLMFQFSDSDFYRPWFYSDSSGTFDFGLERVIVGSRSHEKQALNLVYENIIYSEHGGDKSEEPEDIYRIAFLGERFYPYGTLFWTDIWSGVFPRPEDPQFGLLNWWW